MRRVAGALKHCLLVGSTDDTSLRPDIWAAAHREYKRHYPTAAPSAPPATMELMGVHRKAAEIQLSEIVSRPPCFGGSDLGGARQNARWRKSGEFTVGAAEYARRLKVRATGWLWCGIRRQADAGRQIIRPATAIRAATAGDSSIEPLNRDRHASIKNPTGRQCSSGDTRVAENTRGSSACR